MEKAGLKTFVYSFVFSLFTLLGVHGVFLHTPDRRNTDAKIPSKNITLFLKEANHVPDNTRSAPAKKIILSVLPEIKPQVSTAEQIPLSAGEPEEAEPTTQIAAATDIPLQNSIPEKNVIRQSSETEKIVSNFEQIINSPPPTDNSDAKGQSVPVLQEEQNPPKQPFKSEPVYIPDETARIVLDNTQQKQQNALADSDRKILQKEIVLAQNEQPARKQDELLRKNEPEPGIPLEKDASPAILAKNEIKTTADIQKNQIALNARDIPIKSMASRKQPDGEKKTENEWQNMSDKQTANESETPWIVAKGGKFPRNEMVLQDKAYKQDEEEIRRILSANDKNQTSDKAGTIKLASETVKNLLIPIPDEIMKEKNITPQLVSSGKNRAVEEELATKEISQEEEPANTPPSPDNEAKSSLLNSLSSIFTGKKNTPQIGSGVENDPKNQNSLLSAFTRKKMRPASKILPTEIRLSFQPNRAEISGQTLKWIRAFAQKTVEEAAVGLEIRIDGTSSPLLQRRRLNLLQNILMNEGADQSKIKTVFTAREPNSFILRTVRINNDNTNMPQNRNIGARSNYMQW